jgi:hypothetical protein
MIFGLNYQSSSRYETIFFVIYLDKIDEYSPTLTLSNIFACQLVFFMFLFFIGSACELSVVFSYRSRYPSTYFTYADLAKIKKFSASNCYNVTDLPCSLQTSINFYFILVKCLLVYYSSIIIGMIYVFHCTVRSSSCLLSLYIIIVIIFGTDFILFFDCIFSFIGGLFMPLLIMFMLLEVFLPHNVDDPLGKICGFNVSEGSLYEFLENDTSKSARFYRWVQKMKKQWNIKEEKLILTAIAVVITIIGITIHFIYCSSPSSSEKKLHL